MMCSTLSLTAPESFYSVYQLSVYSKKSSNTGTWTSIFECIELNGSHSDSFIFCIFHWIFHWLKSLSTHTERFALCFLPVNDEQGTVPCDFWNNWTEITQLSLFTKSYMQRKPHKLNLLFISFVLKKNGKLYVCDFKFYLEKQGTQYRSIKESLF